MAVRYRHILARAGGGKSPAVLAGVSCVTHFEPVDGSDGLTRQVLDRWHLSYVSTRSCKVHVDREATGTTVSEWWRTLEAIATVRGQVLLASYGTMSHLALLGFWEGLDDGRIRIGRNTAADRSKPTAGVGKNPAGFIVTEDPPTIAYFYLRECRALIRWNDIRNYGVTDKYLPERRDRQARSIRQTLQQIEACLSSRSLGAVKDTAASQALYSFRRKHLQCAILCHTNKSVLDLERDAYYSGRCECGRIGRVEGPIYELDIRGAYTYTMLHCPVPVRLRRFQLATAVGEMPDFGGERGCIASVTVKTERPDYPYRKDGIVVWPIGQYRTTLCGPELYDAVERGRVIKCHAWAEYDMETALSSYAEEVYSIRELAEEVEEGPLKQWAKAIAVSLVGKLGQRHRSWQWIPRIKGRGWYDQWCEEWTDKRVHRFQSLAGNHRVETLAEWDYDSVPAIAGWITSAARIRLLNILRTAGLPNVLYFDTDSVFITATGLANLTAAGWIHEGELGFLQMKGVHTWMEIHGVKSYRTPVSHHSAGMSGSGTISAASADGLRQSLWLSTYLRQRSRPDSLSKTVQHVRTQSYRHGTLMSDGRVAPLSVTE